VAGAALLVLTILAWISSGAHDAGSAAGVALQTGAGLFAAIQLWANNASDSVVRWAARQIERNRWGIAKLFDGSTRSFVLAAIWCALGYGALKALRWAPGGVLEWVLGIPSLLLFTTGALVFFGALLMFASAQALEHQSLPDGRATTTLQDLIAKNDWIWPLVGLAFLLGGILQIAAA